MNKRKLSHLTLYLILKPEIRVELSYWANNSRYKMLLKGCSGETHKKRVNVLFLYKGNISSTSSKSPIK